MDGSANFIFQILVLLLRQAPTRGSDAKQLVTKWGKVMVARRGRRPTEKGCSASAPAPAPPPWPNAKLISTAAADSAKPSFTSLAPPAPGHCWPGPGPVDQPCLAHYSTAIRHFQTCSIGGILTYRAFFPVCHKVLKMLFWEIPPADWPTL